MPSPYQVVTALFTQLRSHPALAGVTICKNTADIQELDSTDELVIVRDGDPGDGEGVLGGFRDKFYDHTIDVEEFVRGETDDARDEKLHLLDRKVKQALESDITLGGLVQSMDYGEPAPELEPIDGAADIKSALLGVTVGYQSGPAT